MGFPQYICNRKTEAIPPLQICHAHGQSDWFQCLYVLCTTTSSPVWRALRRELLRPSSPPPPPTLLSSDSCRQCHTGQYLANNDTPTCMIHVGLDNTTWLQRQSRDKSTVDKYDKIHILHSSSSQGTGVADAHDVNMLNRGKLGDFLSIAVFTGCLPLYRAVLLQFPHQAQLTCEILAETDDRPATVCIQSPTH
jgi:hypothetical protein